MVFTVDNYQLHEIIVLNEISVSGNDGIRPQEAELIEVEINDYGFWLTFQGVEDETGYNSMFTMTLMEFQNFVKNNDIDPIN